MHQNKAGLSLTSVVLAAVLASYAWAAPSFGAIRWDAWNGRSGDIISKTVAHTMAPEKYHWRLPWYVNISNSSISFDADHQSVMDAEIQLASRAGLSFFAYDTYCVWPSDANISQCQGWWGKDPSGLGPSSAGYKAVDPAYGLRLHMNSKFKHLMNFSLVLLSSAPSTESLRPRYLSLLKDSSFHRTPTGRPLIFLFNAEDLDAEMVGGWDNWAKQWQAFRDESVAQGTGNPYLVFMEVGLGRLERALNHSHLLGFDAISAYALPGGTQEGIPFSNQAEQAFKFWKGAEVAKKPLVPPVPTGWDPRPRADHPPVWVKEGPEHYIEPTKSEITSLFKHAKAWLHKEKGQLGDAESAIVYAWNENTEGGWLLPTKGEGHTRLEAVADAILHSDTVGASEPDILSYLI